VQERGLYFLDSWDGPLTPLLAMSDPGEEPLTGGLLAAPLGEGRGSIPGLALFRQLPEGRAGRLPAPGQPHLPGSDAVTQGTRVGRKRTGEPGLAAGLRVLLVQVVTLVALWWLQSAFAGRLTFEPDALDRLDHRRHLPGLHRLGRPPRSKGTHEIEGYFLANRSLPWWAVGLSVMATQLSAITLVGTTGQGATDGMRFIQFYFGLPLAMIILAVTLVPFFHRAKVFTAYEYLERRFDARTRSLTAALFLMSRGMAVGVVISAPAVIMSATLGLSLPVAVASSACRRSSTPCSAGSRPSRGRT
jgi:hypothetical protein